MPAKEQLARLTILGQKEGKLRLSRPPPENKGPPAKCLGCSRSGTFLFLAPNSQKERVDDVIRHGAVRLDFKYAFFSYSCSLASHVNRLHVLASCLPPVYYLRYTQVHATRSKKKSNSSMSSSRKERGGRLACRSMDSILSCTNAVIAIIPVLCHQTQSGRARGERRWRRFLKTSGEWPNVAFEPRPSVPA